jgi:hypothetical protein
MNASRITEIATKLAIDVKATGFDLGDHYDDAWNLTDEEWNQVCDEAERLLPTVKVPASVYAAWARVEADHRAEQRAERHAFYGDL